MHNVVFAMTLFAVVGAVTPGPVNLIATSVAINHGTNQAAKHVIGASVAYALVVLCCGLLMQSLLTMLPKFEFVMQLAGSAFLLYLAYNIFKLPVSKIASTDSQQSGILSGSLLQVLNPKAWLVAASGVSLYVSSNEHDEYLLGVFVVISLFACLFGVGLWALLGRVISTWFQEPKQMQRFNQVMAVLLITSVSIMWF